MKQKEQERKPGIYGIANVRATKSKVTLTMAANGKNHRKGDEFEFDPDDLTIPVKTGTYSVAVSGDGNVLFSCYPVNGAFNCRFVGFGARKDQPPSPFRQQGTRKNKAGELYDYDEQVFTAESEIVEGPDKGMVIRSRLYYDKFDQDDETGNLIVVGTRDRSQAVVDFLMVTGVWEQEIPYSDNVLPDLEKRILKAKRQYQVIVNKDGFTDKFAPLASTRRTTTTRKVRR